MFGCSVPQNRPFFHGWTGQCSMREINQICLSHMRNKSQTYSSYGYVIHRQHTRRPISFVDSSRGARRWCCVGTLRKFLDSLKDKVSRRREKKRKEEKSGFLQALLYGFFGRRRQGKADFSKSEMTDEKLYGASLSLKPSELLSSYSMAIKTFFLGWCCSTLPQQLLSLGRMKTVWQRSTDDRQRLYPSHSAVYGNTVDLSFQQLSTRAPPIAAGSQTESYTPKQRTKESM